MKQIKLLLAMIEDKKYRFKINVSVDHYEKKDDATAALTRDGALSKGKNAKMAFIEENLNVDEFLEKATGGHSFCGLFDVDPDKKYWIKRSNGLWSYMYPIYKNGYSKGAMKLEFKRNKFFRGAQIMFVDVDLTRYNDVGEYISSLTFKPSCVYMSYSDNKDKGGIISRRFHMVYVFDKELNADEFKDVGVALTKTIEENTNEEMDDKCGERISQYFNGCYGNFEVYHTYLIYSYNDIIKDNNNEIINNNDIYNYLLTIDETEKSDSFDNEKQESLIFNQNLVLDMKFLDYDEFMRLNRHKYKYFYRTESNDWIDGTYQYTDSTFLSLYYNKSKVMDGHKRRKKLFDRCCIRRLIDPSVNADTLLFNLYEDVHRFFDNSDGILTIEKLLEKVESSLSYSIEELQEMYSDTIQYYQNHKPMVIFKSNVFTSERNTVLKDIRYDLLQEEYNRNLTLSENLKILQGKGFCIEKTSLYNFCNERGINTKPDKILIHEALEQHYDSALSIRKNLTNLKPYAPSIKKNDIEKYRKSLGT